MLKVDGGVTANELCMQLQADILGVPVSGRSSPRPPRSAPAYAAGLAIGFWQVDRRAHARTGNESKRWLPEWDDEQRASGYAGWKKAVDRTLNWVVDVGLIRRSS